MRTMYDGIAEDAAAIAAIPTAIDLVAGYDDGDYAWTAADWDLFPNSTHVHIVVHQGTNSGTVLDVESGNATPAQSVDWVLTRRMAGADPTVYCNEQNTLPQVQAAFQARGVIEPHYWVANYDGKPVLPAGAVAKQYESAADWDLSVVADYWPGVDDPTDPGTAVQPAPHLQEDDMSTTSVNGRAGLSWAAGSRHVVQVTYDGAGGNDPTLRVVLALTTGPLVLAAWTLTGGSGVLQIPAERIAACRGVILEDAHGAIYDAVAV
jgi:hypothetical protein